MINKFNTLGCPMSLKITSCTNILFFFLKTWVTGANSRRTALSGDQRDKIPGTVENYTLHRKGQGNAKI